LKILINLNTSWNAYNFRKELIIRLLKEGFKVYVLAPFDPYSTKLEKLGVIFIDVKINPNGINPFTDFKLIKDYFQAIKKINPDVILSYTIKPNIYGNFAARILRIPIINNISGLGTLFIKSNYISYIGKLLYKLSLKFGTHVFFQNQDDRNLFIKENLITASKSSVILGSGVNTTFFKSQRTSNPGKRFLFVGRLLKDKGVIEYLDASLNVLNIHPEKEFLLVGEMGYKNNTALNKSNLEHYLNISPQIKYLGKTDDIKSLLNSVDIMVLPSYREGLSKSLLEAASMTLPIITTNVPGCREVVKHGYNGLLCKSKSQSSLEKAMIDMISLPEKTRHSMGVNGRLRIIENFSNSIVIDNYLQRIKTIYKNNIHSKI
jgi:glycosyltransferase involved in cell wall biosynthesis|tara:strand:- start:4822 stop:5949 length:1128 start_codon:yes stop_codon:yes gene_type:complete